MIETAVAYLGAYLVRKSMGLLGRAGKDLDTAVDTKLGQLYDWVKAKVVGRLSGETSIKLLEQAPEGDDQKKLVADQLGQALAGDPQALQELHALVEELDKLRPPGVSISGLARSEDLAGVQIGVDATGPLGAVTRIEGESVAGVVRPGGQNIGVRLGGQGPDATP